MTIPLWALKALPYVGAVALVGGAVWFIDHRGFERAEEEAAQRETERKLMQAELRLELQQMIRDSEVVMAAKITESDQRLTQSLDNIETVNRTIVQPTLVKEIHNEPRLSNPRAGITDVMREAINSARSLSERACPAGSDPVTCVTLPEAPASR